MIIKKSVGEKVFDSTNYFLLFVFAVAFLYPLWYVTIASFSSAYAIAANKVKLWPVGFNLEAYMRLLRDDSIWRAYGNTFIIVIGGTLVNIIMTTLGAYPLSRKELYGRNLFMAIIVFTMFFHGGLIPTYLNVRSLGLYNSYWALILPLAINTYNLIIMRTFFQNNIPDELIESARIDGAKDFMILYRIVIPISSAIMAVMTLFYGVAHWNTWFQPLIYLRERSLYPLQLILREIIIESDIQESVLGDVSSEQSYRISEIIKYATIVVATMPIVMSYPFLQRFFVKGVMIGAIKS